MSTEIGATTKPSSWKDDLNSYRATVGSKAFSTTLDLPGPQSHFPRTVLAPFADTTHPYYSYAEPKYEANERDGSLQRYQRHGWGDVTLLQHGIAGPHRAHMEQPSGRMRVADPSKEDMAAMLQHRDTGRPDAWVGHVAIDPSAGKKSVPPPFDPKLRKDLFALLNQSVPGKPADDFWMGNIKIDPAKGKKSTLGPEARLGRKNGLFPIIQQNIMREEDRNAKLHRGGDGALADAWIGHIQINPAKGKREIGGVVCAESNLIGTTLREFVPDTDFQRGGRKIIDPNQSSGHSHHDTVHALYAGTAKHDEWKGRIKSKRHFERVPRNQPGGCTQRHDIYDICQRLPVSEQEAARNAHRFMEDEKLQRKRPVRPVPGSLHPSTGPDMIHWKPEEVVASFVPYGNLMQVQYNISKASDAKLTSKRDDRQALWK